MKGRKKLEILGILTIVITSSIAYSGARGTSPNNGTVLLEAEYFTQKQGYYCGQAATQMALYMTQGIRVKQKDLEKEMNFVEGAGTRNINMIKPFNNRDANVISAGILRNQNHLRNGVDNGFYTIINIRFSEQAKSGHYVIVTGYNETGFFVHDPWPERWGPPTGRETGANAYVSSELLQKLWWYRLNWALTIAGPTSAVESVQQEGNIWS